MIYTITFYDAAGSPIGQAAFNVPEPHELATFVDCLLISLRSGWVPGTASVGLTATPVR
jgi:hypothetical protein